jgi:outer membrane protein assembly factor BamE (lipoprotein component of BamABCDE complex)
MAVRANDVTMATIQPGATVSCIERNKSMRPQKLIVLWALALLPLIGGCLVTSNSKVSRSGNYVPEATFDRIEPGKTTAAWVKATLGDPSCRTKVDGSDSEIWKWSYKEVKKGSGTIFVIFAGASEDEKTRSAFIEVKDGVVTKKWRA